MTIPDIIFFVPALLFFGIAGFMHVLGRYSFTGSAISLIVLDLLYVAASVFFKQDWLTAIIQTVLGILLFVLLVGFTSKKASGETILSFVGSIMLAPLAATMIGGLVALLLSVLALFAYAAWSLRGQIAQVKRAVMDPQTGPAPNTPADALSSLSETVRMAATSTYDGSVKAPNYDFLPDREVAEETEYARVSYSLFAFGAYFVVAFALGIMQLL